MAASSKSSIWTTVGIVQLFSALIIFAVSGLIDADPIVGLVLRVFAGVEALTGLIFLFLGLRQSGSE